MADASDMANDSPPAHDRVVETRSEQGSPQVGIAIPSEYSLHKKAHSSAKLLSQRRNVPVGCRLHHCRHTMLYAVTWNVRSLVEEFGDGQVCRACGTTLCVCDCVCVCLPIYLPVYVCPYTLIVLVVKAVSL